mmetsp:Transcript_7769/g.9663  ORF Transcript_7769/g.9663 Transcript_7769/m.9663 type:complete len:211 (-) Transcript_7769:131-763(-)
MPRHSADFRNTSGLTNVEGHTLGKGPFLQQSLFGMFATSPEQLRRLQPEVPQLLSHAVHDGMAVPLRLFGILGFFGFLLVLAPIQALLALLLAIGLQLGEVALLEVFDDRVFGQIFLEGLPEVVDENVLDLVGSSLYRGPVVRNLFCFRWQHDVFSIICQWHIDGLIVRRKQKPMMFESVPLLRTAFATFSTVLTLPPAVDGFVVVFCLQ